MATPCSPLDCVTCHYARESPAASSTSLQQGCRYLNPGIEQASTQHRATRLSLGCPASRSLRYSQRGNNRIYKLKQLDRAAVALVYSIAPDDRERSALGVITGSRFTSCFGSPFTHLWSSLMPDLLFSSRLKCIKSMAAN